MESELEKEFVKLSYYQINKVLDILGAHFAKPIESISKQEIFATVHYDSPEEEIQKAIKTVVRNNR